MIYFVLLCGGKGSRTGFDEPKQYLKISEKPVFSFSIDVFNQIEDEKRLIIAAEPQYFSNFDNVKGLKKKDLVKAGKTRQESVYNALKHIKNVKENDIVIIHDSARIYINIGLVNKLLNEVKQGKSSAIPYKNVTSAIFDEKTNKYINTSKLKIIETPQVFSLSKLKEAYKNKKLDLYKDDGSIFLNKHKCLNFVYNPEINTKITSRGDFLEAERRLK